MPQGNQVVAEGKIFFMEVLHVIIESEHNQNITCCKPNGDPDNQWLLTSQTGRKVILLPPIAMIKSLMNGSRQTSKSESDQACSYSYQFLEKTQMRVKDAQKHFFFSMEN